MRKLIPLMFTLFALVAMAAVACGGGSDKEPAGAAEVIEETTPAPVQEVEPTPTPPAVVSEVPEAVTTEAPTTVAPEPEVVGEVSDRPVGGVLRITHSDPPTLDPHLTSDTTSAFIVVELYSGLVTLTTDLRLVPDIAESWKLDESGTVYTFKLRPDAKFHDGQPVTAHDFKWSLDRAANPNTASPVADTYLNDIVGAEDVFEGRATELSGVRVIDDHTLQITIDAPKAYFLAKLTYPTAYVLDQENVEQGGRNWFDNPNGTGPFKLKEYRVGERLILERNENFYREPAYLDAVVMNLAGGQTMAMYENDEVDISGVALSDLDRVLDPESSLNKELVITEPDYVISYIGFNTDDPPFDDPKFRQALNHAVDKELIAAEVLSGLVVPAYGILPPGFPGYNPDLEGLKFDAELAQQLLSESDYADPDTRPEILITIPGTGGGPSLSLEVTMEMWRQILGVEAFIQQVEWATYLKDLDERKFQAFAGLGWEADYPDPQDFLDILFHTESSINHGGYTNLEVDAILLQARTEQDITRRIELYHEAERLIVEDAPWVPMWFQGEGYVLLKPHVKDYKFTPMIVPKLREVYFEG